MLNKTKTPIKQEVIEGMISRHLKSYYVIGDLYNFNMRNWRNPNETSLSPLLDCSFEFEYDLYLKLCDWGHSIPRSKAVFYENTSNMILGYQLRFKYSFLVDNKIHKLHMGHTITDPIFSAQTMNKKIIFIAHDCTKHVKKFVEA